MHNKNPIVFFTIFASFSFIIQVAARVCVRPISQNVLSLLKDVIKVKTSSLHELPPDITFLFADVKYSGKDLKICEFGGTSAGIADTMVVINGKREILATPYWSLFWHYLTRFNKPLWYVGGSNASVLQELFAVGGKSFRNLNAFLSFFSREKHGSVSQKINKTIEDYDGILVVNRKMGRVKRKEFLKKHPNILLVNAYTKQFTGKRNSFQLVKKHDELRNFFPHWKAYKKKYSLDLVNTIKQELPAPLYIIKPINSLQSNGVIMARPQDLDFYLKLILQEQKSIKTNQHKSLAYWKRDANDTFFVQEYVPSKSIVIKGKRYDPTMRLVFFLSHDQGQLTITVVAGYWKIPVKALSDHGSLTEKHVTQPFSGDLFTGICIDPHDFAHAKQLLSEKLSMIYQAMLLEGSQ